MKFSILSSLNLFCFIVFRVGNSAMKENLYANIYDVCYIGQMFQILGILSSGLCYGTFSGKKENGFPLQRKWVPLNFFFF